MRLMDVITAYLYGELDTDIYMKVPEGLKLPEATNEPRGYANNVICPSMFIKKSNTGFAIVAVYVDDMNLVGTPEELNKTAEYLKSEFEMKNLGKTKYCLGLQIEHCANGILVHQSAYIEKILKRWTRLIHLAPQWSFVLWTLRKIHSVQKKMMNWSLVQKYHI
ncbi:hypothetical protein PS2_018947 [Malus domestica]